jgi:hypothetical protein
MNEENNGQLVAPSTPGTIQGYSDKSLAQANPPSSLDLSVADLHNEIDKATHLLESLVGRLKPVLNEERKSGEDAVNEAVKSFATPSARMVQEATIKVGNLRKTLSLLLQAVDL